MLWPGVEGPRHPSPIYQALVDGVLVFVILWWFARQPRPRLAVGAMYTLLYGCARFFTEYFRVPDWEVHVAGVPITSGQMLSLPMIVAGLAMLAWSYSRKGRGAAEALVRTPNM
jgi:phosphatidylglycerol:prolipoprotein diacylglycerol transferase